MVKKGNQVTAYNRKGKNVQDKNADTENKKIKEYKGVKIISIPTINKKGIDAVIYSFLASIRASFGRYDVLHYHAEGSCAMLWIPHLFHKKIVVTIHGLDWKRGKWQNSFGAKYIKHGEKCAVKYADEIIVLSENVKKYFKETYGRDTTFIPNGVNKPVIRDADIINKKYGLTKNSYILFLARIVPEKGLDYLIDAYNSLTENEKKEKKLVIAGGASHTNDYLNEIKDKVSKSKDIIMTGFIQGNELDELFSNCYLYCLPSDIEGMPISLLEAFSYGANCLVSDIEENTQVVENMAATFKKSDIKDLNKKLKECLDEKNRKKPDELQNYILNKYDWDNIVDKTLSIYKKLNNQTEKK